MPERLINPLRDLLEEKGIHLSEAALRDVAQRTAAFVILYVSPNAVKPPTEGRKLEEMSKAQRFIFGGSTFDYIEGSEFVGKQTDKAYYLFSQRLVGDLNERRPPVEFTPGGKTYRLLCKLCTRRPDPTYDWEAIRKMIPRTAVEIDKHPVFGISIESKSNEVWCLSMPEPDDSYAVYLPTSTMALLRGIFNREVMIRGSAQGVIFYTRWMAAYVRTI